MNMMGSLTVMMPKTDSIRVTYAAAFLSSSGWGPAGCKPEAVPLDNTAAVSCFLAK